MKTMNPHRCPRDLTEKQREILKNLMRRKFYDLNHPEEGRRYPILFRAFIPADYQGNPTVLLVCQYTKADKTGKFEYAVFSDGLYGRGHWPSDKFGAGDIGTARAAFEKHLVHEVLGVWPWVIRRVRRQAKKVAADA
jgi:hypothetical protein